MSKYQQNPSFRTDLANERYEILRDSGEFDDDGLENFSNTEDGCEVYTLKVKSQYGADKCGKPIGEYITIDTGKVWYLDSDRFNEVSMLVSRHLKKFIPRGGSVLVAGLGNRQIISDAVGAFTLSNLVVTRHIKEMSPKIFSQFSFRETSAILPDVLGNTGIEAAQIIKGAADAVKPCCIIAVDALCARKLSRLCTTVQISNTGICPGSGVGNSRQTIDESTMNIPVIALGIPTVVSAATIASDILSELGDNNNNNNNAPLKDMLEKKLFPAEHNYYVTPKESDSIIKSVSKLAGYAINLALQENLTVADIQNLL